jgi:lactate permease
MFTQNYDPFGNSNWSIAAAAAPIAVLLSSLAFFRVKAHWAALIGLVAALFVATLVFGMPARTALSAALFGAVSGVFPIGWTLLAVAFFGQLLEKRGSLAVMRESIAGLSPDHRLLAVLAALAASAFFAGAGGQTAAVAIAGVLLVGLGLGARVAAALALTGSAAAGAFAAVGAPVAALAASTGIDVAHLSATLARQMPLLAIVLPFWLVWMLTSSWRLTFAIWPALAVAGLAFAVPLFVVATTDGPWLADVVAGACSTLLLGIFLKLWRPREAWVAGGPGAARGAPARRTGPGATREAIRAWMPWVILAAGVALWSIPAWKAWLDRVSVLQYAWPLLHEQVRIVPPAVEAPMREPAIYVLNWLSSTGTGVLAAAAVSGLALGFPPIDVLRVLIETTWQLRGALFTIAAIAALGMLSRYAGFDATIGLGLVEGGAFWPLLATLLGALGVALTGSGAASNHVLGGLQAASAAQFGVDPSLFAAAQGTGASIGAMIDPGHVVVATSATRSIGHEGALLRKMVVHAVALAVLVGLWIAAQVVLLH